jgi:hypothetical protein
MSIIGQPDKMFRYIRNSKRSTDLFGAFIKILVTGENHNVSNLVFSLRMSEYLTKLQDTAISLLY